MSVHTRNTTWYVLTQVIRSAAGQQSETSWAPPAATTNMGQQRVVYVIRSAFTLSLLRGRVRRILRCYQAPFPASSAHSLRQIPVWVPDTPPYLAGTHPLTSHQRARDRPATLVVPQPLISAFRQY